MSWFKWFPHENDEYVKMLNRAESEMRHRELYEQDWTPATMSKEDYDRARGCPYHAHDCSCAGKCPWRAERDARTAQRASRARRNY